MCGIFAVFGLPVGQTLLNRALVVKQSLRQRHRGPDNSGVYENYSGTGFIAHERLTIIDTSENGKQPFVEDIEGVESGRLAWIVNSEIYNHMEVRKQHLQDYAINSHSDSVVVGYLYRKYGHEKAKEWAQYLDGIFASIVYDEERDEYLAIRDPIGICPMYWGKSANGAVWFASEMKAIENQCVTVEQFPPGHVYSSRTGKLERWYNPVWREPGYVPTAPVDYQLIQKTFINSVVKRLMSDVPLGVLLSGGLDSSLVASVAVRHLKESRNAFDTQHPLNTFSIGIKGSPDLKAARKVADFLGTNHHEFHFTVQEGIDALHDLIYHIESFEQVRAAVPMYLLARRIKAMGIKVVLSGEGADEIFGGYLYFHKAPNPVEFHNETVRKVDRLHMWDVLRANKAPFAHGLETRVPFLDKKFLDVCMNIDPADKMCDLKQKPDGVHKKLEKYILRKAFDVPEHPYLPEEVLFRQKEQFSDGVGYDWVDGLKDYAEKFVTDEMWSNREYRFPKNTPRNKEYYLLRSIFEEHFPSEAAVDTVPTGLSVACSTPEAVAWDPSWDGQHEISGRAVQVHESANGFKGNGISVKHLNGVQVPESQKKVLSVVSAALPQTRYSQRRPKKIVGSKKGIKPYTGVRLGRSGLAHINGKCMTRI
eukprot:TRINITY_DN2003_c1_g1_i6.p1 TRINITY_DN2003_c1_g1~~TRINITY_DN2003_c1_g1_i6.p1  ORF type:complete len:649 (-),score=79.24 TRINITY_DN2003_c1_g1_i6:1644-3590(-)